MAVRDMQGRAAMEEHHKDAGWGHRATPRPRAEREPGRGSQFKAQRGLEEIMSQDSSGTEEWRKMIRIGESNIEPHPGPALSKLKR